MAELGRALMLCASVQAHSVRWAEPTELFNLPFADNEGDGGCGVSKQNMGQTDVQLTPDPFHHQTNFKPIRRKPDGCSDCCHYSERNRKELTSRGQVFSLILSPQKCDALNH